MKILRIALAQMNSAVGALTDNVDRMAHLVGQAHEEGARLVVFPELAISGYPPEDLILQDHFVDDCERELVRLAGLIPPGMVAVAGSPRREEHPSRTLNAAAVLHNRQIAGYADKMLLPNYGVFDEQRVFDPGERPVVLVWGEARFGLHICEDSWFPAESPTRLLADAGLDALLNLSSSPYHRGKLADRQAVVEQTARALGAPVLYANLVGGQDELVFDGTSLVIDAGGQAVARAERFREDLLYYDLPVPGCGTVPDGVSCIELPGTLSELEGPGREARSAPPLDDPEEVYRALELGLRDYVEKNGFRKVLIAVSGGIDSALVAALAVDALGPDRVVGVTMPSQYSSSGTLADAGKLCERLGIRMETLPILGLYDAFEQELAPLWPDTKPDVTEENLQARIRGVLIMALSNKFGWLVLATGNKSELATGYCTLYGDMAGGFAVIKDVPKTLVFALSEWRNHQGAQAAIPPSIIERPPSAELRADQQDTDSLPPYPVLDAILESYVERDLGAEAIIAAGHDPDLVRRILRLVDLNEYKRRQAPPGVKITPKAFGRDRRMPITNRYRPRTS